jgi:hypothetical protein
MPDRFTVITPAAAIVLADGEHYAGLILNDNGTPSHHLVLLPEDHDDMPWQAAVDWATAIGGELPTRREQSLLFANGKQHFKADWYWSSELHASGASYAWGQGFGSGYQDDFRIHLQCRAVAVRRLPI